LFELAVRDCSHLLRKKILLQVNNNKEGDQEIPDAEMSLGRQDIFVLLAVPETEEGPNLVYQVFLRFFLSYGWHIGLLHELLIQC
jgi:hypothetical protein